jgi:hypothetical protein
MAWIEYDNQKYKIIIRRLQCLNCSSVVQGFEGECSCGRVIIKNGKRNWPYFPIKDVSLWESSKGDVLPQMVLDHFFELSRGANKTGTNTKASTSTS